MLLFLYYNIQGAIFLASFYCLGVCFLSWRKDTVPLKRTMCGIFLMDESFACLISLSFVASWMLEKCLRYVFFFGVSIFESFGWSFFGIVLGRWYRDYELSGFCSFPLPGSLQFRVVFRIFFWIELNFFGYGYSMIFFKKLFGIEWSIFDGNLSWNLRWLVVEEKWIVAMYFQGKFMVLNWKFHVEVLEFEISW